jgi:hypothetical protein
LSKIRAKWAKTIAAASGIKKAIGQCLKDNGGIARDLCDSAGLNSDTTLGKYGILQYGLDTLNYNYNAETLVSIGTDYGVDANTMVSIDIKEANPAKLGGCSFHLVPTVQGGAGTIVWQVLGRKESAPATTDVDCVKLVKGAQLASFITLSGSSGYVFPEVFRKKWLKALTTLSSVKGAITRCLIHNAGDKTQCDSVLIVKDKLQKYGISSLPAGTGSSDGAASDSSANWISMNMGKSATSKAGIVIKGGSQLADCKVTVQPSYDAGAKYVKWSVFAQATNALADDAKCASFVNGAIAGAPI